MIEHQHNEGSSEGLKVKSLSRLRGAVANPRHPMFLVLLLVAILGGIKAAHWFTSGRYLTATDDAQVQGDVYPVSPKVSGYIKRVYVKENQFVHTGDLLFEIDSRDFKAELERSTATVSQQEAEARRLDNAARTTDRTTLAQQEEAAAAREAARSLAAQSKQQVRQAAARVRSMQAEHEYARNVAEAESRRVATTAAQVKAAEATRLSATADLMGQQQQRQVDEARLTEAKEGVQVAEVDLISTRSDVTKAEAQVSASEAAVRSANAAMTAAKSERQRTRDDAVRIEKLYNQGAVSQQARQAAQTTAVAAESHLTEAQESSREAASVVEQARAALVIARNRVQAANSKVREAEAGVDSATAQVALDQKRIAAAEAAVKKEEATVEAARSTWALTRSNSRGALAQTHGKAADVEENRSKFAETLAGIGQVIARLQQAHAQSVAASARPYVVASSAAEAQAALAKKRGAAADLKLAQLHLGYTRVYAPADGIVSQKSIEVGQYVEAGQPLMAVVPLSNTWVVANYKETTLSGMKPGQPALIEADAYPGRTFHGRVESISAGTGSRFSLLPPENATGNFVKVVQRVPVKIMLDEKDRDPDHPLRVGMNVDVTVNTR